MDGGGEMGTVLFSIGILAIIAGMMTCHYMLGGIVGAGSFLLFFGLYDYGSWLSLMLFALRTILFIIYVFFTTYWIYDVFGLIPSHYIWYDDAVLYAWMHCGCGIFLIVFWYV